MAATMSSMRTGTFVALTIPRVRVSTRLRSRKVGLTSSGGIIPMA